ncbi:MAG: FtsQ-type POTRA domain-containing protein [Desulfobacteraceae bacterium]|nr:FtsQ-type POTRA domain-containing protein [Desulfobacteraceae bacterium]
MARVRRGLKLSALILILSATSALFVMGYAAVTRSEYFQARAIKVSGNVRLTEEEIMAQAGVHEGDNLLALNLRLVRQRLLAHEWIAQARVSREIPGAITIQVQEQAPLARVDLGRIFLMNAQGRIFKEVKKHTMDDLPLVSGLTYNDISMNEDTLKPMVAAVCQVLTISQKPQSAIAWQDIERLDVDKEIGIIANLKNHLTINLGLDQYETKFERMARLRPRLEGNEQWRAYRALDLSNPDRVVVRLEKMGKKV